MNSLCLDLRGLQPLFIPWMVTERFLECSYPARFVEWLEQSEFFDEEVCMEFESHKVDHQDIWCTHWCRFWTREILFSSASHICGGVVNFSWSFFRVISIPAFSRLMWHQIPGLSWTARQSFGSIAVAMNGLHPHRSNVGTRMRIVLLTWVNICTEWITCLIWINQGALSHSHERCLRSA